MFAYLPLAQIESITQQPITSSICIFRSLVIILGLLALASTTYELIFIHNHPTGNKI